MTTDKSIAEQIFDGHFAVNKGESLLMDVLQAMGVTWQPPMYSNVRWDWYDNSIELDGVDPDVRLTPDQQMGLKQAGFCQGWLNHTDGMETFYRFRDGVSDGWRKISAFNRTEFFEDGDRMLQKRDNRIAQMEALLSPMAEALSWSLNPEHLALVERARKLLPPKD